MSLRERLLAIRVALVVMMGNTLIAIIGGVGALRLEMGAVVAAALMLKEAGQI